LIGSGWGKLPTFSERKKGVLTKIKRDLRRQVSFLMLVITGPHLANEKLLTTGVCLFLFVSLFVAFTGAATRITASENEKTEGTVTSQ